MAYPNYTKLVLTTKYLIDQYFVDKGFLEGSFLGRANLTGDDIIVMLKKRKSLAFRVSSFPTTWRTGLLAV